MLWFPVGFGRGMHKACIGVEVDILFNWRNRSVSGLACRSTCINVFLGMWCSASYVIDRNNVLFIWTSNSSFLHSATDSQLLLLKGRDFFSHYLLPDLWAFSICLAGSGLSDPASPLSWLNQPRAAVWITFCGAGESVC